LIRESVLQNGPAGWEIDVDQSVLALAELHRNAVLERDMESFGMDGIRWLSEQRSLLTIYSQNMIGRYEAVMESVTNATDIHDLTSWGDDHHSRALGDLTRIGIDPYYMREKSLTRDLMTAAIQGWPDVVCATLGLGADPNHEGGGNPCYPLSGTDRQTDRRTNWVNQSRSEGLGDRSTPEYGV
jgi:hypothetical protein